VRNLKAVTTAVALVAMFSTAFAQQDDLRQLASNRDKKLASEFLKRASWTTNYDDARTAARTSGKLILGYFTRSYAPCGPCMQLEQTVLSKPEFVEFSKDVVLFCHISTRIPTEPFNFLFAEKGGNAFPTLMVLDEDGNVLARQCGDRTMRAIRDVVAEGRQFDDMIQKANASSVMQWGHTPVLGNWAIAQAKCDCETQFDCLTRQVQYGHLSPEVARARAAQIKTLSADRKAYLEAAIVSRECSLGLLEIRKACDEPAQLNAAKRLVEMKRAGHIPSDSNVFPFWDWVMSWASHNNDITLYEDGLIAMKALLPNDSDSRDRLQEKVNTLDRMKRELRAGSAGIMQNR
jgi:hypothetical protein